MCRSTAVRISASVACSIAERREQSGASSESNPRLPSALPESLARTGRTDTTAFRHQQRLAGGLGGARIRFSRRNDGRYAVTEKHAFRPGLWLLLAAKDAERH